MEDKSKKILNTFAQKTGMLSPDGTDYHYLLNLVSDALNIAKKDTISECVSILKDTAKNDGYDANGVLVVANTVVDNIMKHDSSTLILKAKTISAETIRDFCKKSNSMDFSGTYAKALVDTLYIDLIQHIQENKTMAVNAIKHISKTDSYDPTGVLIATNLAVEGVEKLSTEPDPKLSMKFKRR